ncbi:hypothetical protein Riv7116_5796 [Rivularia sp. PCC 7116]|nr:hypothetical protein Riv7116_5796 [Rivularia sp. PCC 7116]
MKALPKLIRKRYALFKVLIIGLLVLNLTACGGKAVSKDISIQLADKPVREKNAQLSRKISEVAPPEVIQELRQNLENYQPQVQILNPKPDEVLQEDKLTVRLQVKDLPIFKDARYGLGSHLDVILDNQAEVLEIYDLDKPLELSDLSPGTHTLRVFASRAWNESFKNEGAYAQTTFHVFTKSDDNNPTENLPILTYNSPQGSYGAEPILLDFYLTNAPLHILAKDNPDNPIADWRIRCTINDESFIIDRWQSLYLKGFNEGKNWVKLEFLDNQGNPVKNVYNSTVKVINYEPQGKDTLAKMVRGEISTEDLRGIVDADYAVEIPTQATPEMQSEEKSDKGGFFDRFKRGKEDKTSTPETIETPQPETELEETIPQVIETPKSATELEETIPEVIETPQPETELEETIPEIIETPKSETELEKTIPEVIETPTLESTPEAETQVKPQPKKSKLDGFLNRFKRGKEDETSTPKPNLEATPEIIETPQTELEEITPEVIETPTSETELEKTIPEVIETPTLETTPEAETQPTPQPKKSKLDGFLNRFKRGKEDKTPEMIETPAPESEINETDTDVEGKIQPTPELPTTTLPEIVEPLENEIPVNQPEKPQTEIEIAPETKKSTTKRLGEYFNLTRRATPVNTSEVTPEVEVPQNVPVIEQPNLELIEK